MKLYFASLLLFFFSQTLGEDLTASQLKSEILQKLLSPNDTSFEADAKDVIAQYLAQTVFEDSELNEIVAFGRDKDKDKDRNRNKPRDKPNRHKPHKPHIDYRDPLQTASPISNNNQGSALNNAAVVQSVAASDTGAGSQSRQDVTQVPILTAAPAGSNTAAPAAGATNAPGAVNPAPVATAAPVQVTAATVPGITRPTVSPEHVYNQVDKILGNVATGNIVGIVDESLAIRAPMPVRNFVTGILKVIFCNPVDRLLGRCRPNSSGAISSVQGR